MFVHTVGLVHDCQFRVTVGVGVPVQTPGVVIVTVEPDATFVNGEITAGDVFDGGVLPTDRSTSITLIEKGDIVRLRLLPETVGAAADAICVPEPS